MFRSPFVKHALELREEVRDEYLAHEHMQYLAAERATNGRLLNRKGMAKKIDSTSLWRGTATRAYAYASDELKEHWARHPRVNFEEFEKRAFLHWLNTGSIN